MFISLDKDPNVQLVKREQHIFAPFLICPIICSSKCHFVQLHVVCLRQVVQSSGALQLSLIRENLLEGQCWQVPDKLKISREKHLISISHSITPKPESKSLYQILWVMAHRKWLRTGWDNILASWEPTGCVNCQIFRLKLR